MNNSTIARKEFQTMTVIADRALELYAECDHIPDDKLTVMMDIEFAHIDTPLDLDKFLGFSNENFAHDMFGIRQHMNRKTKQLDNCFQPRCAVTA